MSVGWDTVRKICSVNNSYYSFNWGGSYFVWGCLAHSSTPTEPAVKGPHQSVERSWGSAAYQSSWENPMCEFRNCNYDVMCVQVIFVNWWTCLFLIFHSGSEHDGKSSFDACLWHNKLAEWVIFYGLFLTVWFLLTVHKMYKLSCTINTVIRPLWWHLRVPIS